MPYLQLSCIFHLIRDALADVITGLPRTRSVLDFEYTIGHNKLDVVKNIVEGGIEVELPPKGSA